MIHVILYQPEIPSNTGAIIRLCANTGAQLHLIHPLGFSIDDRKMRRAGLDYHEQARVMHHQGLEHCLQALAQIPIFAFTTRSQKSFYEYNCSSCTALLFGPETRGLGECMLADTRWRICRLPMHSASRSLNLANAVSIAVYEVWRQQGFVGEDEGLTNGDDSATFVR